MLVFYLSLFLFFGCTLCAASNHDHQHSVKSLPDEPSRDSTSDGFEVEYLRAHFVHSTNFFTYVTDRFKNVINIYLANGKFLYAFGENMGFDQPSGVELYDGELYIADIGNNRIVVTDPRGSKIKRQWGSGGTDDDQFDEPHDVAVGPDGDLYITDTKNARVAVYGLDGTFKRVFSVDDEDPTTLAFDSVGRLHVTHKALNQIFIHDPSSGNILDKVFVGPKPKQMNIDACGYVYVALSPVDYATGTEYGAVNIYDENYTFLRTISNMTPDNDDGFVSKEAFGVDRDSDGELWITDGPSDKSAPGHAYVYKP